MSRQAGSLSLRRVSSIRRRFGNDQRGSAAVEFALVAPAFLALTFSILEAGFYFFITSSVDAANARAARLVRTGQAQTDLSRDDFFNEICKVVQVFGKCDDRLTVDVSRFSNFSELAADMSAPVCRDADPKAVEDLPYNVGAQRDIVRVRVCYLHRSINPGLGLNLGKAPDGSVKMISTSILRNEPFQSK